MKRIITLIILFAFTSIILRNMCAAQGIELPMSNEGVQYREVIETPGRSKSQLYISTKKFIANSFKSSDRVIDMDDPNSGIIIAKGNFSVHPKTLGVAGDFRVDFVLTVECKDERYRYAINGLVLQAPGHSLDDINEYASGRKKSMMRPRKYSQQIVDQVDEGILNIIYLLDKEMNTVDDF